MKSVPPKNSHLLRTPESDIILKQGLCRFKELVKDIKMKSSWVWGFLMPAVLEKRWRFGHRHNGEKRPCQDRGRDHKPRRTRTPQKLEEEGKDSPPEPLEKADPTGTLISVLARTVRSRICVFF